MIDLPMSTVTVWGQLRDLRSSATHDPFHKTISIDGNRPRPGAHLQIEHQYLLFKTTRVGRILIWREGCEFAFSDLCRSDPTRAFPHVIRYRLEPINDRQSRLHLIVTGRWTLGGPRWIGRIWLSWVFWRVVTTTTNQLLIFAVATGRAGWEK
jgi:hypothetical protein